MASKSLKKSRRPPFNSSRRNGIVFSLLLAGMVMLAYLPATHCGFIWDDDAYVTENPLLTASDGLKRIWFSLDSPSQYFPLVYTTFRIEHALWGFNPAGYHWSNILLHIANTLLLFGLLRRLKLPGAWLAAAIWGLHPVQVESVAWITERKNVLSGFFYLLALRAWVEFTEEKGRRVWPWYAAALLAFAFALFAKTTACTLPAALLLVLWLKKKPIDVRRIAQVTPFVVLGLGMGLLTVWWERYHQGTEGKLFAMGWMERFIVASRAVWFYLGKLAWPAKLTFSYPRWTINPADPFAYGWLAAGIAVSIGLFLARRFTGRGPAVAALYYVATLSPMLGFIMLYTFRYTFVADHYQYLASIGPIALLGAASSILLRYLEESRPFAKAALYGTLLAVLGLLTWQQSEIYRNNLSLWTRTLAENPGSWLAHNNIAQDLIPLGRLDETIAHSKASLALYSDNPESYNNLGIAFAMKGELGDAIAAWDEALRIQPDYALAHYSLGIALAKQGRLDDAIGHYRKALEKRPYLASAHNNLGNTLMRQNRIDEAIAEYQAALRIQPGNPAFRTNLDYALSRMGASPHGDPAR